MRGIGWFSGGVTSALAIKKSLEYGLNLDIFFFETGQHHEDTIGNMGELKLAWGLKAHARLRLDASFAGWGNKVMLILLMGPIAQSS